MLLIADTSVLINFLKIDRMHLIGKHVPRCVITEHVVAEVTELYAQQKECLAAALADGHLEVISVIDAAEVEMFGRIQKSGRLGVGESSAIAVAIRRGYALGIDDRRAIRDAQALAAAEGSALTVWRTQDIVVRLIQAGQLSVEQADVMLVSWRTQHSFNLRIQSFSEVL